MYKIQCLWSRNFQSNGRTKPKSPASSFLSPAVHPPGTGWWGPNTPGPLWSCPHPAPPVIWLQSSGPVLSAPSSLPWSSHDSDLWGSIGRAHRCDGSWCALSFFLLLANSHWVLVGKQPLLLHPAPQPAPVARVWEIRTVKGTSGNSSACLTLQFLEPNENLSISNNPQLSNLGIGRPQSLW